MSTRADIVPSVRAAVALTAGFVCLCAPVKAAYAEDLPLYFADGGNKSFVGDADDLTPLQSSGLYSLSLNRGVVWSVDLGAGSDVRSVSRLANGHTLIADAGSRRVVEYDGASVEWDFDAGDDPTLTEPASASYVSSRDSYLIADAGNQQVMEVSRSGKTVVWRFGSGEDPTLKGPTSAQYVSGGRILIADPAGHQVVEVARDTGAVVRRISGLSAPRQAQRLADGTTLIVDQDAHRVFALNGDDQVTWSFGVQNEPGSDDSHLDAPTSVQRVSDGTTVIADTGNGRVLRVSKSGQLLDEFYGGVEGHPDWTILPNGGAVATSDGLLVGDSVGRRLIEVGYGSQGVYDTGAQDLGVPGVNKWITAIIPSISTPSGTSVSVEYRLGAGEWTSAGDGSDFVMAEPKPTAYARFRITMKTTNPGVSPVIKSLLVPFYLQEPPVLYRPPSDDSSDDETDTPHDQSGGETQTGGVNPDTDDDDGVPSGNPTGGDGSDGEGTPSTTSDSGTYTSSDGIGTPDGIGSTTVSGGVDGTAVVAENVPMSAASAMLSGWLMNERATPQAGGTSGGRRRLLADPAGLLAASLLVSFAYSTGLSQQRIGRRLMRIVGSIRTLMMRSANG